MEAMEALLGRRSIRKYKTVPVEKELISELLAAAMAAPSSSNRQPWHFIVVDDPGPLTELSKIHNYSGMLAKAALGILVCGDMNLDEYSGFWVQDCSAATQNMLIAAHAKGLGAVWIGLYPKEECVEAIQKIFSLPGNITPLCIVSIGYPYEPKPPANRYDEKRIHFNKW